MAFMGFGIFQKALNILTGKEPTKKESTEESTKKETKQHPHSYEILLTDDGAPVKGGGHTCLTIMRCEGCPQVIFFPLDNFKLTTEEYQNELLEALVEKGYQPVNA